MSISLEYAGKSPTHPTNEISIQVDPNDYFNEYLKKSQGLKTVFSRKKLEFSGKQAKKEEPILKYFPSTVKFKNKKKTFLHSIQVEEIKQSHRNLKKDPSFSSFNKKQVEFHSKSSEFRKKPALKLKKNPEESLKHIKKPRKSKNEIKTCESDFIRPRIYDPISNFFTEVLPITPIFQQPAPKIYKNHLFNKLTQSRSRFSTPPESSPNRSVSGSRHNLRSLICSKINEKLTKPKLS